MRSTVTALMIAVFVLSVGVFAQNELPKSMQDATPVSLYFKNVSIPEVLTFLGKTCGVEVRVQGVDETAPTRQVQFAKTKVADVFAFLVQSAGLSYTVVDEKTVIVTKQ